MDAQLAYRLAADAVLLIHAGFVVFIVIGLLLILAGRLYSWRWVGNPWFRLLHLIAIGVVVLQSWLGVVCPLTTWEMALREKAGGAVYAGSFIAHWLESMLYYRAPAWAFITIYTVFGLLVLASWHWVKPRPFKKR